MKNYQTLRSVLVRAMIFISPPLALAALSGCVSPGRDAQPIEKREYSGPLEGSAAEFTRGVANLGLCWVELPTTIERNMKEDGGYFTLMGTTWDVALGTVTGAYYTVERAVGGAAEVVMSPFPPYDPMLNPATPFDLLYPKGPRRTYIEDEKSTQTARIEKGVYGQESEIETAGPAPAQKRSFFHFGFRFFNHEKSIDI